MRDPGNLNHIIYNNQPLEIMKFDEVPEYDLRDYDLNDEKEFKKYIQKIERIVRTSFEYRQMTNYLREYLDMNKCSFYSNVNNIDTFKIKIHIHHEPFTLYAIVKAVYNKRSAFGESLSEDMVSKEVMYLHYMKMVGLIPLAETVHELVHNQYLFIPVDAVFGNYQEFVRQYEEFIDPEDLDSFNNIVEYSKEYSFAQAEAILNENRVYLDMTGAWNLPRYEDIISAMSRRIAEVKESNRQEQLNEPLINVLIKTR